MGKLTAPVLVAAFEGWNDAGEAASGVVSHLGEEWGAKPVAAMDPEDFYDFQVTRPVVEMSKGQTERLVWPTTRFSVARPEGVNRDIVLVYGIEPNMRWRAFSDELVASFAELKVELVVLLGALLADAPHTRPVPVSAAASDPRLAAELNASPVDYKGPTGIVGVLAHACRDAGIPAVSLWASVPHYVAQPPSPKATLALLRGVEDVLDLALPLADLSEKARAWESGSTSSPSRTPRWRTTCARWKSRRTRRTCPRRAGTRSPGSSSGTCGAGATPAPVAEPPGLAGPPG